MKKIAGIVCIVSMVWMAALAGAETIYYPDEENGIFSIALPDEWQVEFEDEMMMAGTEDETVIMLGWSVDAEDIEMAGEAVDELIANFITDIEWSDKGEREQEGIKYWWSTGTGTETKEGTEVVVDITLFSPDDELIVILVTLAQLEGVEEHEEAIDSIFESIELVE